MNRICLAGFIVAMICGCDRAPSPGKKPVAAVTAPIQSPDSRTGLEPENAHCIAFSPDGRSLAIGRISGRIDVADLAQRCVRLECDLHAEEIVDLVFSPDSKHLLSISKDRTMRVWEMSAGKQVGYHSIPNRALLSAAWTADGLNAAVGMERSALLIWEPWKNREVAWVAQPSWHIRHVVCTGDVMVLAGGYPNVNLADPVTGVLRKSLENVADEDPAFGVSGDGKTLVFADRTQTLRLLTLPSASEKGSIKTGSTKVVAIAVSSTGTVVATADERGGLAMWDVATGKPRSTTEVVVKRGIRLAFSTDDRLLAVVDGNGRLELWEAEPLRATLNLR